MKLRIDKLSFELTDNHSLGQPFSGHQPRLNTATQELRKIAKTSGTRSEKFQIALELVENVLVRGGELVDVLCTPIELRALALLLGEDIGRKIRLSSALLDKISDIRAKPGSLLIESIFSHYLKHYDHLEDMDAVESWLMKGRELRNEMTQELRQLLGGSGPGWLAEESRRQKVEFDQMVSKVKLDLYAEGRFLTVSKNIYYLDVLRGLTPNEYHPLLDEMQKKSVYMSRYDERSLLGHKIVTILVGKAAASGVGDTWMNIIMTIAGDPRVPVSHPNHLHWWSKLDPKIREKVQGWLSKLDLGLFLEALENFSFQSGNMELKRMYPARKTFMEGLLKKQIVTGTRLFLSSGAESFLKKNYKEEHLPNYTRVEGQISLIYVQLGSAHMIEGSHSCKLWIYERLDPSAIVFDYTRTFVSYKSLTGGLCDKMKQYGIIPGGAITHTPQRYNWQKKAIEVLQSISIDIAVKDVLSLDDYQLYKRFHGDGICR